MTLKNEPRREPSLADLEAFERLLRDSLKVDGMEPAPAPDASVASTPPPQPAITADSAMAEFNRLVEAPVVFEQPGEPPSVSRISAIEQALRADLDKPPQVEPAPAIVRDPLLDFEEELRRFEAMSRPAAPVPANPVEPAEPLRGGYPGEAQVASAERDWSSAQSGAPRQNWSAPQTIVVPEAAPTSHDALAAAENRLNAEAEAAAYAGGAAMAAGAAAGSAKRSRGIFFALGGVAVAGLAVIGGVTAFSGSKNASTANNGKVPVIAAKPEPAKEKPANPGGLEVPDQNKQVLAARNAPAADSRPAQVVNQTEQPVDLNQIARRDSVRVVAPSPFQPTPGAGDTPAGTTPPGTTPAPAAGEPRRVQSVRIADPVAPPPAVTPVSPPAGSPATIGAGAIAAIGAGAIANARPAPSAPTPSAVPPGGQAAIRPQPPVTPPAAMPAPPAPPAATEPPKAETRPQSPVTRPAATANPPPRPPAANNGPLPLSNSNRPANPPAATANPPANPAPRVATAPAAGGGGAFAIQLASRPSEADAQNAGRQLGQRYSGQIGGKSPVVVRGEANGQTVYRVRVTGFAQADATAACDKIRAAGGACFVTRQ